MEYNKNHFQKVNDHKVLHKVKKQWVVISMSLLALLGGGAVVAHVSAHAETNSNQNHNSQTLSMANVMKNRINASLTRVQTSSNQDRSAYRNQQAQTPQNQSADIAKQADVLHNRILRNATYNDANQIIDSANDNDQSVNGRDTNNNMANDSVSDQTNQRNVQKSKDNVGGNISAESLKDNRYINSAQSVSGKTEKINEPTVGDSTQIGNYKGLDYTYNPGTSTLDFTDGTLNWNNPNGGYNNAFIGDQSSAPGFMKHAKNIKFSNGVNIPHLTTGSGGNANLEYFIVDDTSLQDLYFGSNLANAKTKNVTETLANGMLASDYNLKSLTVPNGFFYPGDSDTTRELTSDKSLSDFTILPSPIGWAKTEIKPGANLPSSALASKIIGKTFSNSQAGSYEKNDNIQAGNYDGLNYKYYKNTNAVEFTGGTLNWSNGTAYNYPAAFIGNQTSAPSVINNAKSIKFDSDVNTKTSQTFRGFIQDDNHVTNIDLGPNLINSAITGYAANSMQGMFTSDYNLQSVSLPYDLVNNTPPSYLNATTLFNSDKSLDKITIYKPTVNIPNGYPTEMNFGSNPAPDNPGFNGSWYKISDVSKSHPLSMVNTNIQPGTYVNKNYTNSNTIDWTNLRDGTAKVKITQNPDVIFVSDGVLNANSNWPDNQFGGFAHNLTTADGTEIPSDITLPNGKKDWTIKFNNVSVAKNSQGNSSLYFMFDGHNEGHSGVQNDPLKGRPNFIGKQVATIDTTGLSANGISDSATTTGTTDGAEGVFINDDNLQHLIIGSDFGNSVSKIKNWFMAFGSDRKLQNLDLSKLDMTNATTMQDMFDRDSDLKNLTLGGKFVPNNSNQKNMAEMFASDPSLAHINNASDTLKDAKHIIDTNAMFDNDKSLNSDLNKIAGSLDISSDKNTNKMFQSDYNLTNLDLSNFNTSNVKNMSLMFAADKKLNHLNLGNNFNTSDVSDMSGMFGYSDAVSDLVLPAGFDTCKAYNNNKISNMFESDIGQYPNHPYSGKLTKIQIQSPNAVFNDSAFNNNKHDSTFYNINKPYTRANLANGNHQGTWILYSPNNTDKVTFKDLFGSFDGLGSQLDGKSSLISGNPGNSVTINSRSIPAHWLPVNTQGMVQNNPSVTIKGGDSDVVWLAPAYDGLVYKYDPKESSVEFISGTSTWNQNAGSNGNYGGHNFLGKNALSSSDQYGEQEPNYIYNAQNVKFDDTVDFSQTVKNDGNVRYMFADDPNVRKLDLGDSFMKAIVSTNNSIPLTSLFQSDSNLEEIDLPGGFGNTHNIQGTWIDPWNSDVFTSDGKLNRIVIRPMLSSDKYTESTWAFESATFHSNDGLKPNDWHEMSSLDPDSKTVPNTTLESLINSQNRNSGEIQVNQPTAFEKNPANSRINWADKFTEGSSKVTFDTANDVINVTGGELSDSAGDSVKTFTNSIVDHKSNGDISMLPSDTLPNSDKHWTIKFNNVKAPESLYFYFDGQNEAYNNPDFVGSRKNFIGNQVSNIDLTGLDASNTQNAEGMFINNGNLQSIETGGQFGQNSGRITNWNMAFGSDDGLNALDLSQMNMTNAKSTQSMFESDKNLTQLTLSNNPLTNVSDFSDMFNNDPKLPRIKGLSNALSSNSSAKTLRQMFRSDKSLNYIKFPSSFDTSRVSDMGRMFESDKALNDLTLPASFNTSAVRNMEFMFQSTGLDSYHLNKILSLHHFDTSNVVNMAYMFGDDQNLKDPLKLPTNFNTESVKDMHQLFASDLNLPEIDLPSDFTTKNAINSISDGRKSITLYDPIIHSTGYGTGLAYMFLSDKSLGTLVINNQKTNSDGTIFNPSNYHHGNHPSDLYTGWTTTTGLSNPWYQVSDSSKPRKQWLTKSNPTQLSDGQNHLGTWVTQPDVDATINYVYQGKTVGTSQTFYSHNPSASFEIGSHPQGLPREYYVIDPNQSFNYDDQSHNVNVASTHIQASGNWDLSDSNSAHFEVLSDGNSNRFSPEDDNDTLVISDGPMKTNNWSKAGYKSGNNHQTYVFSGDGNSSFPNALGRHSFSHVIIKSDVTLPSDSSTLFRNMGHLQSVDLNVKENNNVHQSDIWKHVYQSAPLQFDNPHVYHGLTNMSDMFSGDGNLKAVDLSSLDLSNVTTMADLFSGDSALSDVNLPSSHSTTNKLNTIAAMFSDTSLVGNHSKNTHTSSNGSSNENNLNPVTKADSDIHNLNAMDVSGVSDMEDAFNGDTKLQGLNLSKWRDNNVSNIGSMFLNDSALRYLDIRGLSNSNIIPDGDLDAFQGDFTGENNPYDHPYAIVLNNSMRLGEDSGLKGMTWASPDYKNDPLMFSPRKIDQYGSNLGHNSSATWIKVPVKHATVQFTNQSGQKVPQTVQIDVPPFGTDDVTPAEQVLSQGATPKGYQPPLNSSLAMYGSPAFGQSSSNRPYRGTVTNEGNSDDSTDYSKSTLNLNVLGKPEQQTLKENVRIDNDPAVEKPITVYGYYGDTDDTIDCNNWQPGPSDYEHLQSDSQFIQNYDNNQDSKDGLMIGSGQVHYRFDNGSYAENENAKWDQNEPNLHYASIKTNIKVNYVDQNGSDVGTMTLKNPFNPTDPNANAYVGESIRLPTSDQQAHTEYGLNQAYHLVAGQPARYVVQNRNSTFNLYVTGDEDHTTQMVNVVYENSDGSTTNQPAKQVPVTLYGYDGDHVAFDPASLNVPSDYVLDTQRTASPDWVQINGDHSRWVANQNSTISVDNPTVYMMYSQAVLRMVYINQDGQRVGCSDVIRGRSGQQVNVTDPSDGGMKVPTGYRLRGNYSYTKDNNSDHGLNGQDQNTIYRLRDGVHSVFLRIQGQPVSSSVVIYRILEDADGRTTTLSPITYSLNNESDGSDVEIDPAAAKIKPSDCSVDYGRDGTQYTQINYDPKVHQYTASPNQFVFYYQKNQTSGAPIILRYIDDKTGNQVEDPLVLNGNLGERADVTKASTSNGRVAGMLVPDGYTIDTSDSQFPASDMVDNSSRSNPVYQFTDSPQAINIPVQGDPKTLKLNLRVIERDALDQRTLYTSDVPITISGRIGQRFEINPYGFSSGGVIQSIQGLSHQHDSSAPKNGYDGSFKIPDNSHATISDADLSIGIDPNGQLSPLSHLQYTYVQNYSQTQVGTVRIHYVTDDKNSLKSNGVNRSNGKPNDNSEVDEVSDKGIIGDQDHSAGTFNLAPYRDDIPEKLVATDNYESANNAMNKDGITIANTLAGNQWQYYSDTNGFHDGIRDVYIQVKKRGTDGSSSDPIIISTDGQQDN